MRKQGHIGPVQSGRRQLGFNLIELVVTLTIGVLLLTLGAPVFANYVANARATTPSQQLLRDLVAARTEASRTGFVTSVVSAGEEWAFGWQVERDDRTDEAQTVLVDAATPYTGVVVRFACGARGDHIHSIPFAPLGELASPLSGVTFIIEGRFATVHAFREITVAASGRAEVRRIDEDAANAVCAG
jgi:prepilin-type N-terminal cleavage/methylation domain-containing protein